MLKYAKISLYLELFMNCAKSNNSKKCIINLMSYIQQFWSTYSLKYYHSILTNYSHKPEFTDCNSFPNLFGLTIQIFLMRDGGIAQKDVDGIIQILQSNIIISYKELQNVKLGASDSDSDILLLIKSNFKYAFVQMHQILTRLIVLYYQTLIFDQVTKEIEINIKEIGYMYPALKAQISINQSDINLNAFFDTYLSFFFTKTAIKPLFKVILSMIKEECHMFGRIQTILDKYICSVDQREEQRKKANFDSQVSKRQTSIKSKSIDSKKQSFDQKSMFRKSKKILKERFKVQSQNIIKTPIKKAYQNEQISKIQKSDFIQTQEQSQSGFSSHSSAMMQKILLKSMKKPLQRTLYHATKHFSKAKHSSYLEDNNFDQIDYQLNLKPIQSATLIYETTKKVYPKQITKDLQQDQDSFCVPATPKLDYINRTDSCMNKTLPTGSKFTNEKPKLIR